MRINLAQDWATKKTSDEVIQDKIDKVLKIVTAIMVPVALAYFGYHIIQAIKQGAL